MSLFLYDVARLRHAVGKINLAWGKADWRVSSEELVFMRRGGANRAAKEPRPWRIIKVWWCLRRGEIMIDSGYTPSGSLGALVARRSLTSLVAIVTIEMVVTVDKMAILLIRDFRIG